MVGSQHGDSIEIPSGSHRFEFSCPLPQQLPASFFGKHGSIIYTVEVTLSVPWGNGSGLPMTKEQFSVVRIDDLNDHPDLKIAVKNEEIKKFCCCCCTSKPLMMTVTLSRTGFFIGENIQVTVSYNNKSDVRLDFTRMVLTRIVRFKR